MSLFDVLFGIDTPLPLTIKALEIHSRPNKKHSAEVAVLKIMFEMAPNPESSGYVREITRSFVAPRASNESLDAILIAITEAVSNCIRHARTPFRVELIDDCEDIVMIIHDKGPSPFDGNAYEAPTPGSHDGKIGVPIMLAMMDEAVWSTENGTTVRMRKAKSPSPFANMVDIELHPEDLVLS